MPIGYLAKVVGWDVYMKLPEIRRPPHQTYCTANRIEVQYRSPGSDTYQAKDKSILSLGLTVTVPIFPQSIPNLSLVVQGGPAWINKSVTYNCNGLCDVAGTPRFSETQNLNILTSYVGIGVQQGVQIGGFPMFLSGNFQQGQGRALQATRRACGVNEIAPDTRRDVKVGRANST
jgi:hypothetical protein